MLKKLSLTKILIPFWLFLALVGFVVLSRDSVAKETTTWWEVQSIDTMKLSRDLAREKLQSSSFDKVIEDEVARIAATGATHVAIATPYDEEFIPILSKWVSAAREKNLNVWFRGNFSGWENWFNYPSINREEHTAKIFEFIVNHPDFFEDGDIFTSCTECENGGPGDPRKTGDVGSYRAFLRSENDRATQAFKVIKKDVKTNYFSMNGDVAKLVMDPETTQALGGIVVVDHYVASPQQMAQDIADLAESSKGKIVIGEFGAPIPDIHGEMSEDDQARWLAETLSLLSNANNVVGLNYWVASFGSSKLVNDDGTTRKSYQILKNYYTPSILEGAITNSKGWPIGGAKVTLGTQNTTTNIHGYFTIPYVPSESELRVQKEGYFDYSGKITTPGAKISVKLLKSEPSIFQKILVFIGKYLKL